MELPAVKLLISLDIDGTMEFGDPPGPVTVKWVREAKNLGYIVGSSSDRPISSQRRLWKENDFDGIDFVMLKHWMPKLKQMFKADEYWHIGDGDMDQLIAVQTGFEFFWAESFPEDIKSWK